MRQRKRSHQIPVSMQPLVHQIQQSLLLMLVASLAAFHRSKKTVSLPVVSNSRDSSSAANSSDTLTVSSPWNSPLKDLSSCLEVQIRPCDFGLYHSMTRMKKLRSRHQLIRWRPNTNQVWSAWPFHPIAVASSVVASTRRSSFMTLARKNSTWNFNYILVTLLSTAYYQQWGNYDDYLYSHLSQRTTVRYHNPPATT